MLQAFVHSFYGAFCKIVFGKWADVFEIYEKKFLKSHVMKTTVMARTFLHYSLPWIC